MNEKFRIRARRNDRIAKWVITFGGMLVILSVVLILVLITNTSLPLFQSPQAEIYAKFPLSGVDQQDILAIGVDEYLETGFFVDRAGIFHFFETQQGLETDQIIVSPPYDNAKLLKIENYGRMQFGLFWDDGSLTLERVAFKSFFDENDNNRRTILHELHRDAEFAATEGDMPTLSLGRIGEEGRRTRIDLLADGQIQITQVAISESLFGDEEEELFSENLASPDYGEITSIALDSQGKALYAGTSQGYLLHWSLQEPGAAELLDELPAFADGRAISALSMVFGDYSLAVGDTEGKLTTWFPVRVEKNRAR